MDVYEESGLTKAVWCDADFEQMGWHDVTRQYVRRPPRLSPRLVLGHAERGGCSFAETAFER